MITSLISCYSFMVVEGVGRYGGGGGRGRRGAGALGRGRTYGAKHMDKNRIDIAR